MPHVLHWLLRWTMPLFAAAPLTTSALTASQVFDKVKDSILLVQVLDAQGNLVKQGSGVVVPSGKVATNCHVLEAGARYQVGKAEQFVPAILDAEDSDRDLCLIVPRALIGKPATLGKAAGLKVGEAVFAVGAPQGLELSLSDGIVSQLRGSPPPFIQMTAAISPGSSGGGLFDAEGRLVGITSYYLESGQGLNFALPVEWLAELKPGTKNTKRGLAQGEWLARVDNLIEKNDWQGLLDWCLQWTRTDPGNGEAWFQLGWVYSGLSRHTDAIAAFRHALRINPEDATTWFRLGGEYRDLGRHTDAIDAYRQGLRINPEHTFTWFYLGLTYRDLDRHTDAIKAFRQILRIPLPGAGAPFIAFIRPKDDVVWFNLGLAYRDLGRHTEAIDAFRNAVRINPGDAVSWFSLGLEYEISGNRPAALDVVRELRRIDPVRADRLLNLLGPK